MQVLFTVHELLIILADTPVVNYIIIEPDPKISLPDLSHVIKIKYNLEDNMIKKIEPIVIRRNLKIQKLENEIVIH